MTGFLGMDFASPLALLLLLALPAWWLLRWRRKPAAIVFSRADVLAGGPRSGRMIARLIFVLRNLALAAMIVALARPRAGARAEQITSDGINIAVVIDISSSMLAEDFRPRNRMQVAKETAKRFVQQRRHDRIALVSFSGEALTQVPLTMDYPVLMAAIDNLAPGQLEDGTAIGTAVVTAANRLRDVPEGSRVMILLTDGENNRGWIDPRTAARAAAAFDIRIYTIGVGTEGMAPMPVGRGPGGLRYEYLSVGIDEPLLRDIASFTGGRYFRATDAAALQRVYEQIDVLERAPIQARTYVRYTDLYRFPLAAGLLLLGLEVALLAWRGPLP